MEPILARLVTSEGTAIAKGALKRWLKDYPEALGATGAIIDVPGTVAKGLIDHRRSARQHFGHRRKKTLSEAMQRQDQITGKADLILKEVSRIRASLQNDSATETAFEEKYRRAVTRNLDELKLCGVDVANTSKRYRPSVADGRNLYVGIGSHVLSRC